MKIDKFCPFNQEASCSDNCSLWIAMHQQGREGWSEGCAIKNIYYALHRIANSLGKMETGDARLHAGFNQAREF